MEWEIVIQNDNGVEKWGPYPSKLDADEAVAAFVGVPESATVRPTISTDFDGCPM